MAGGDALWLQDNTSIPLKLRQLTSLCIILTKTPSSITFKDIQILSNGANSWTIAEIVQALGIRRWQDDD